MALKKSLKPRAKTLPLTPLANLFRHIQPTWRDYIRFVKLAAQDGEEEMESILTHYNALTMREKRTITPEQLCELADVSTSVLVAQVVAKCYEMGRAETQLITASLMSKVVLRTATVAASKSKFASKEREMFLKGSGFLPTPHGTSINVTNSPQTLNVSGRPELGQLPGSEDEMLELEGRETKLLLASKVE